MALILAGASPGVIKDVEMHAHECYEIIMNAEGEGVAEIGGREYPFSPGTIHIVPPNTGHCKRSDVGFRDLYLHTDVIDIYGHSAEKDRLRSEPVFLPDDSAHMIEDLMSMLLSRYLQYPGEDMILRNMYELLMKLISERCRYERTDPVAAELADRIASSYNDPEFRIARALAATGYSPDHIRRRFLHAYGITPAEYLKQVRIRYAKSLLRQKHRLRLSIGEIALMCGFYDAAYFCRVFTAETGINPSSFAAEKQ